MLVVVGLAVGILLVIVLVLCFRKIRRRRRGTLGPPNSPTPVVSYVQGDVKSESLSINAAMCQVVTPELAFLK